MFLFFQYFFKHGYCEIAIKGLEDFCKDFDGPMKRKDTSMEMVCMYICMHVCALMFVALFSGSEYTSFSVY